MVRFSIALCLLFAAKMTNAQKDYRVYDVFTPNGSQVVAYITGESSEEVREYFDSYFSLTYPNAEQIKTYNNFSSTRRFNCHGYAWHMKELSQPLNQPRWIGYYAGNTDVNIYWDDCSYVEISSEPYPGKVSWSSGDHSAVTTQETGWFISKWNEYPLMKHRWDDSPYGTADLKYYVRLKISGPTTVCNTNTPFTLNNLPQGFTVTWSNCSNLRYVSGQGTPSYVVRARNTSVSGFGTVTATLSGPCDPVEIVKEVWVGAPTQPTEIYGFPYNGYTFTGSTSYYFSVSPHSLQTVSSFEWSVGGGTIQNGAGSNSLEVLTHEPPPGTTGNFNLSVRVGNTCGISPWLLRTGYVIGSGGLGLLNVSPNPASVEITISEEEPANDNIPWVLRLMSQQGAVVVNVTAVLPKTINVQGLQPGVYVLHASRGQYVEQQVVIVE